ncbi:MAG TPA: hypothetical protein PL009_08990 [Flavipsychrobacter sp.]|nr:hypothetical protein [Flavipsychrobacter sp.]
MDIAQAVSTIEYKIATESENFEAGQTIKMDINSDWPAEIKLAEALRRKYPYITLRYDYQANGAIQMIIANERQ